VNLTGRRRVVRNKKYVIACKLIVPLREEGGRVQGHDVACFKEGKTGEEEADQNSRESMNVYIKVLKNLAGPQGKRG